MSTQSGTNYWLSPGAEEILSLVVSLLRQPSPRYWLTVNTVRLRRRCQELGISRVPEVVLVCRPGDSAAWWNGRQIVMNAPCLLPRGTNMWLVADDVLQAVAEYVFLNELRHAWQDEHRSRWWFQRFGWPIIFCGLIMGAWGLMIPSLHQGAISFGTVLTGLGFAALNYVTTVLFFDHVDRKFIYPRRLCELDAACFAEKNADDPKWQGIIHFRRIA